MSSSSMFTIVHSSFWLPSRFATLAAPVSFVLWSNLYKDRTRESCFAPRQGMQYLEAFWRVLRCHCSFLEEWSLLRPGRTSSISIFRNLIMHPQRYSQPMYRLQGYKASLFTIEPSKPRRFLSLLYVATFSLQSHHGRRPRSIYLCHSYTCCGLLIVPPLRIQETDSRLPATSWAERYSALGKHPRPWEREPTLAWVLRPC